MLSELVQLFLSLSLDFLRGFIVGGLVGVFLTGLLGVYFFRKYSRLIVFERQSHDREAERLRKEITELYLRLGERG